jgi:septum formation protein
VSTTLVLASASTSRARMLQDAGVDVEVAPSYVDEDIIKRRLTKAGEPTENIAMALAVEKARSISAKRPGALVIGADQILVCEGQLYDKPTNLNEAVQHLRALSGRQHHLVTAACVLCDGETQWQHLSTPRLVMRALDGDFIQDYLAAVGDKALTSVGAYQLEGRGAQLFEVVDGDFFAILGLPLLPLLAFLRDQSVL